MKAETVLKKIRAIAKTVQKRRPYLDDKPDGYLESDRDYLENNNDAAVKLLDLTLKLSQEI